MCACPIVSKAMLTHLRNEFPVGSKVRLTDVMQDEDEAISVPVGTVGTVNYIDDVGTLHVSWETGSSLGLIYGVDKYEKV